MSNGSWGEPHSRTVTWYDPVETAAQGPRRRATFADGGVRDDQGRLVATASSTCPVFAL